MGMSLILQVFAYKPNAGHMKMLTWWWRYIKGQRITNIITSSWRGTKMSETDFITIHLTVAVVLQSEPTWRTDLTVQHHSLWSQAPTVSIAKNALYLSQCVMCVCVCMCVCGHLEQSRELCSSGETRDLPLNGFALQLQLGALIWTAELLRQTEHATHAKRFTCCI